MKVRKSHRVRLLAPAGTVVTGLLLAALATGLAGCRPGEEEPGVHVASWAMIDARQRHPIVVTDQPANLTLRVAAGAYGLTPSQRAQTIHFLRTYGRSGASRLAIAVPSGSPNEPAAVRALGDLRSIVRDAGIDAANVTVGPYRAGRDASAPIKVAYAQFRAEAPECGLWPDNLANDPKNLPYANFGCASQRNLAVQIANPADLLGPRSMTPSSAERRDGVYEKYIHGQPTPAARSAEERLGAVSK